MKKTKNPGGNVKVRVMTDFSLQQELVRRVVKWYHGPPGMPPFDGDPTEAVTAALELSLGEQNAGDGVSLESGESLPTAVDAFEKLYIRRALEHESFRLDRTAVRLGIAYSTMKKKVHEHKLFDRPGRRKRSRPRRWA